MREGNIGGNSVQQAYRQHVCVCLAGSGMQKKNALMLMLDDAFCSSLHSGCQQLVRQFEVLSRALSIRGAGLVPDSSTQCHCYTGCRPFSSPAKTPAEYRLSGGRHYSPLALGLSGVPGSTPGHGATPDFDQVGWGKHLHGIAAVTCMPAPEAAGMGTRS